MVLSNPAMNTTSMPRREAVITGAAETCTTSISFAIKAGIALLDDIDRTSMSKPSFANAPISLAIHTDAIVAEVLRYATRRGLPARPAD
jgi:hypothetical protein